MANLYSGNQITRTDVLGRLAELYKTDPTNATRVYQNYTRQRRNKESVFYDSYSSPTNQAVQNLADLGFDTSYLSKDYINQNRNWIQSNLDYRSATGNTPGAPTKNSTANQQIAYQLYQWDLAEDRTQKAESEWQKAMNEASYWAQRTDRNYSDDEIIAKVRKDFNKKYSTLASLEEDTFSPVELNRGVDFSDDVLRGAIWAARNGGGTGDYEMDMFNSYVGEGNGYKRNERIANLLNPESDEYLPYATGSTNLDDAAQHFGMIYFPEDWCNTHKYILSSGTDEDIKYFRQVQQAEDNTQKAEKALKALDWWLNNNLSNATDYDEAKADFERLYKRGKIYYENEDGIREEVDLSILKKMDQSLGMDGNVGTTDLLAMTRGVNYKYGNILKEIQGVCEYNAKNPVGTGSKYIGHTSMNWFNRTPGEVANKIREAQDNKLKKIAGIYEDTATESEKNYVDTSWSASYVDVVNHVDEAKTWASDESNAARMAEAGTKDVQVSYGNAMLPNMQTVYDYEKAVLERDYLKAEMEKLQPQYDMLPTLLNHAQTITIDGVQYSVELDYDPAEGFYAKSVKDMNGNEVDDNTPDDIVLWSLEFQDIMDQFNKEEHEYIALSDEQKALKDQYNSLKIQVEDLDKQIEADKDKYEESVKAINDAQESYSQQMYILDQYGLDTSALEVEDAVLAYLSDFADYEATAWSAYNPSDAYRIALASGQDINAVYKAAEEGNQKLLADLDDAKTVKEYLLDLGLDVPKKYMENLDRHIAKLEQDIKDYEYFMLSKNDDFKELAQKGRDMEYENRPRGWIFGTRSSNMTEEEYFNDIANYIYDENEPESNYGIRGIAGIFTKQLTEGEKDIYYYLMAKGEKAAAVEYLGSLMNMSHGVLHTRYTQELQQGVENAMTVDRTKEFTDPTDLQEWQRENANKDYSSTYDPVKGVYRVNWKETNAAGVLGQNILAILASPWSAMASLGYAAYTALSGEELNPDNVMLTFNNFRTKTREQTAAEIVRTYGEGTTMQRAAQFFYEMISNRLDSAANMMVFGGGEGFIKEFLAASPMGISAAMDAMMNVKRRGGSDAQAWMIGGVTFLAETGTEAISMDNIKKAFKIGEDISVDSIKTFLANWLKKAGPSELIGESLNDIIENRHDEIIMKELSEHADKVYQYRLSGMSKEDAELAARLDEIKGVIRTAVMSYLSPGMDIVSYTMGRQEAYWKEIKGRQKAHPNESLSKIIKDFKAEKAAAKEAEAKAEQAHQEILNSDFANGEGAFNLAPEGMNAFNSPEAKAAYEAEVAGVKAIEREDSALVDAEILKSAENAPTDVQTANIAGVLDTEGTDASRDRANAAAANIGKLFSVRQTMLDMMRSAFGQQEGKQSNAIQWLQKILTGAHIDKVNVFQVKQGIQYAALGGAETQSYKVIKSTEFQNAAPNRQAQMLATAGYIDSLNNAANETINKVIYENRVAEAEKNIHLAEEDTNVSDKEAAVVTASIELDDARTKHENLQNAVDEAAAFVEASKEAFKQQVNRNNKKRLDAANGKLAAADTVATNYAQNELKKAQENLNKAELDLQRAKQDRLTAVREQAIQAVADIDKQRADAMQKMQEQQKAAQQAAEERRLQQEEIRKAAQEFANFSRLNAEDFVKERFPNISEDEYKRVVKMVMNTQKAMGQSVDAIRARKGFVDSFTKKFNLQYDIMKVDPETGKAPIFNARIDPKTGKLQISSKATQSDVMYAVLVHELTHLAEQSDTYTDLADVVLKNRYGDDASFKGILDAMNKGDLSSQMAQDILAKKGIYDKALNANHTYQEMLNEIVADSVGSLISGDEKALAQIATKPSLAKRIVAAIRNFINKCKGLDSDTLTQAQKVADMLESMVNEGERKSGVKHSISESYMSAVENGDNETAQQMVDEYAKEAGYNVKAYHGTKRQFNGFRFTEDDLGIHLGTKGQARQMAGRGKDARIVNAYVKLENPIHFDTDLGAWEGKRVAKKLYEMGIITEDEANAALISPDRTYWLSDKKGTENLRNLLISKGYDGFTYPNYYEGYANKPQESIAVFNPNQIKLSDAVTYDNNGNAIPLDQRFSDSKDIRYSISPEGETVVSDDDGNPLVTEFSGGTVDVNKYSLNTYDLEEREKVREALYNAKGPDKKPRFTKKQVDKYLDDALSVFVMVEMDRHRLDYISTDPNKSMWKSNADYGGSLDASTLCAKRLLYQGTFDAIQHALPNTPLMPEDLTWISNLMSEMGYETPCGICYVESRRKNLDSYIYEWLQNYKGDYIPRIDEVSTTDGLEKIRVEHPQTYDDFMEAMKSHGKQNDPKVVQLRTEYKGEIRSMTDAAIAKAIANGGIRIQSFSDFETPHLLDMMQAVMDMASQGLTAQAYTKVPNFAWVFGDTGIKINLSEIGKGIGYEIANGLTFDQIAAMPYEEASKLIHLLYDDVEGMNHNEAIKLREKYSKNVGTILVGINDAHIIAAMADDEVDFIIPFHSSGWTKQDMRLMPTIEGYTDYQNDQNEKKIKGRRVVTAKKEVGVKAKDNWIESEGKNHPNYKVTEKNGKYTITYEEGYDIISAQNSGLKSFKPLGQRRKNGKGVDGYWDYSKTGTENAEEYLRMCAKDKRIPKFSQFLVDNGDGSFSLPQGDDYRSTAIRKGYWKTLIDGKMYDNDGNGARQMAVTPNVNMNEAYRVLNTYDLSREQPGGKDERQTPPVTMADNNSLPVAWPVVDRVVEALKDRESNYKQERSDRLNTLGREDQWKNSLDEDIDQALEDMTVAEWMEMMGIEDEDEDEVREIITASVKDIKDEFDPTIYNGKLYVKPKTMDYWLSGSGFASSNPDYAQAYITTMNPADFLRMTTTRPENQQRVLDETQPLNQGQDLDGFDANLERNGERQPIQLHIDTRTGKIEGHEGRHRSVALARAGVTEVPVLLFDTRDKYGKQPIDSIELTGQNPVFDTTVENGNKLTLTDLLPLANRYRDELYERFTPSAEDEANAEANGQRILRYSLPAVEPVEPSSDDWNRDVIQSFPELKATFPNMYNIQDDRTEEQKKNDTSIAGTVSTYRKIFSKLKNEGFDGTILDASSGMGLGARAGREEYGLNVADIEPFPDPGYTPSEGTDYSKLNKKYDAIISNAVLNVLTQDERDALVTKMGQLLNDGGRMFINVRGVGDVANLRKNIDTEWIEANGTPSPENPYTGKKNIQIGENEYYTGKGTYQKGFTPQELASYVMDVLGPDYSVTIDNKHETSGSSSSGIIVTKNANGSKVSQKYSLPSDAPYLSAVDHGDMDKAQEMVDEKAKENGYVKAAYHGTLNGGFTVFDKSYAGIGGNSGAGFYFSSNPDDSGSNYSDVEGADNWFKANHLADRILEDFRNSDEEDFEYEGYKITEGMPYNDVVEIAKKILTKNPQTYHVYLDPGNAYIRDFNNSTNLLENAINGFDETLYDRNDYDSEDDYLDDMFQRRSEEIYQAISDAVYNAFGNIESNYEIISGGDYADIEKIIGDLGMIAMDYDSLTWNDLIKVLNEQYIELLTDDMVEAAEGSHEVARAIVEAFGYDSIEDREVSKKFNQLKNMGNAGDTVHYIMFHPEQIKLADPVTYDDDGNVIPLSERFNTKNEDIRYSLPSDDVLQQIIQQHLMTNNTPVDNEAYAAPLEGQNPQMTTDKGPAQRQSSIQTLQRSDELDQKAKDYIAKFSSYFPDTNADQVARAIKWIRSNKLSADSDGFRESVNAVTSKNFDYRSADGQARIIAVMGMAAARGDVLAQTELEDAYARQGTDLARALQARKIFFLMTPEGRKQSLRKMLDQTQEQLGAKGINVNLKFSEWINEMAEVAESEADFRKVRQAAAQEIAEQIPANWKDRLRSLRMLAMLGNPRTHIRNLMGNLLFVPVVGIKNKLAATMELSKPQGQRTKTTALRLNDEIRNFAKQDARDMKDVLTGEAKYNELNPVDRETKAFKGLLQAVMDFNSDMLEKEDWLFLKGHYTRALGGWMQANGYTAADMKKNSDLLAEGRAYAVLEAQKATYRDFNELAKRLNDFVRNPKTLEGKAGALLVESILPFKKTPANILRRGLEYSAVGLVKSLTYDLHQMNEYNKFMKGDLKVMPEDAITPNQWIDKLSAGLTGTGIMALGALLSKLGLVTCGVDDDDDPEKAKGKQEYSIKILGTDYTYTIDWAAPGSIPFFVGAAMMQDHDDMDWNDFANALASITEPVYNLSMLDGLSSVFQTSKYDDTDAITQILAKIMTNYISSYYPSAFGAATRTFFDDTRRKSYVPSDQSKGVTGTVNYSIEALENKIPVLSQTNIPYRDIWGNPETSSFIERLFENFISPGYIQETKNDPILNEMSRLYGTNVENSNKIMPGNPSKTYKGHAFTAEEYDKLYTTRGQTAHKLLLQLMDNEDYQNASDSKKVDMISNIWSYANKVGLASVVQDYDYDDLGEEATDTIAHDGKINGFKADMLTALDTNDMEGYETKLYALEMEEIEDSQIKQWIGNKYRPLYKSAYKKKDRKEMARIESILDSSGFYFDIMKWEDDVDNK